MLINNKSILGHFEKDNLLKRYSSFENSENKNEER